MFWIHIHTTEKRHFSYELLFFCLSVSTAVSYDRSIKAIRVKVPDSDEEFLLHPATVRRNDRSAQSVVCIYAFQHSVCGIYVILTSVLKDGNSKVSLCHYIANVSTWPWVTIIQVQNLQIVLLYFFYFYLMNRQHSCHFFKNICLYFL